MSKSELDPPMARAALAFGVGALFGVLTLGANLARADTALPPRAVVRESDPRCEKLNSAMVRLKEVHRVPIRIIYSDTASIQIIIPKLHESKARTAGMMELTDEEIVFQIVGDPEYSGSVRTVLAGAALSLGFIAGWRF
jgi:hypothetical protein